jgi:hypothetical protein
MLEISRSLGSFLTTVLVLAKKSFKYEFSIDCMYKIEHACKFACGIRELHATPIMFFGTAGKTGIKKGRRAKMPFTIWNPHIYLPIPIQLSHFQADQIWCDGTFNWIRMKGDGKYRG